MSPTTEPDLIVIPAEWPPGFRQMARAEALKRAESLKRTAQVAESAHRELARAVAAEFRSQYGLGEEVCPHLLLPREQVGGVLGGREEVVRCQLNLPGAEPIDFAFGLTRKSWVDHREIHWHQCPISGKSLWWKVGAHLFPRHDLSGALFLSLALRQSIPSETTT